MHRIQKFNSEATLHQQIVTYIKIRHPNVLFRTDFAAGIKLTPGQAVKHKKLQSGRAWPDIFLPEPRIYQSTSYHGAFIELKKEGTRIYKKDGELVSDAHIREQYQVLKELQLRGYFSVFAVGFEEATYLITGYLSGDLSHERMPRTIDNNLNPSLERII